MATLEKQELTNYIDRLVTKAKKHAEVREGLAAEAATDLALRLQIISNTNDEVEFSSSGLPGASYFSKPRVCDEEVVADAAALGEEIRYVQLEEGQLEEFAADEELTTRKVVSFSDEAEDELHMTVREEHCVAALDRMSQEYPYLYRLHRIKHKLLFGQLITTAQSADFRADLEQSFAPTSEKKHYDDITWYWAFKKKHFEETVKGRIPFTKVKRLPKDYEPMVAQALETRRRLTEDVLVLLLQEMYEKEISLKDMDIDEFCATPQTSKWLRGGDDSEIYRRITQLEDPFGKVVGFFTLYLPHVRRKTGSYGEVYYRGKDYGGLHLKLLGSSIDDYEHLKKIGELLENSEFLQ